MSGRSREPHRALVEHATPAEILPGLYRAVLDAVAALESRGRRVDAAMIRTEATRVYSKAWTVDAVRRLRGLQVRAARLAEGRRRGKGETVLESLSRPVDLEQTTA